MKKTSTLLFLALAIFLLGCESEKPEQTSKPAPKSETGRFALQKMIPAAHLWATDAQPVSLKSNAGKDNLGHDGKASYWQAVFVSPAKSQTETFSWSATEGVDHGIADSYSASNRTMQPFDLNFLKVDSDKAFEVGQEHGGKQLLAKNPNQEVFYLLDWNGSENLLRWHALYGTSPNNAQLSVTANAATGEFIHKE